MKCFFGELSDVTGDVYITIKIKNKFSNISIYLVDFATQTGYKVREDDVDAFTDWHEYE